jgi:hypothetical protein
MVEYASALNLAAPGSDYSAAQLRTYIPTTFFLYIPLAMLVMAAGGFAEYWKNAELSASHAAMLAAAASSLCAIPVAAAYRRFAGTSYDRDRIGFAASGGFDIVIWVPVVVLLGTALIWSSRADSSGANAPASPWLFATAGVGIAVVASAVVARRVFRARFGAPSPASVPVGSRQRLIPALECLWFSPVHFGAAALLAVALLRALPWARIGVDDATVSTAGRVAITLLFLRLLPLALGGAKPLHAIGRTLGAWWRGRHRRRAADVLFRKLVAGEDVSREVKTLEEMLAEGNLDWGHLEALLWHRILSHLSNRPELEEQSLARLSRFMSTSSQVQEGEQLVRDYEFWLATTGSRLSRFPALARLMTGFPRPAAFRPPASQPAAQPAP